MVLLEVSLINLILRIFQVDEMEGESGVTRSIIDEIHSRDIQRDEIEGESGVTRKIIDEFHAWDIQRDEKAG